MFLQVLNEDDNSSYRNVCKMSVVSFALAVIFIIRLFILHDTEMSISLFSFVVLVSEEEV